MTLGTATPFGLRDIEITPFTDTAGTTLASASIKLPNSQTMEFKETETFVTLRGDDSDVAAHGGGAAVAVTLGAGGLSLEAYAAMYGGTVVDAGSAGTEVKTYSKQTHDARPYIRVEGTAISDAGGDVHVVLAKVKMTGDASGTFADGAFWITGGSGVGFPDASGLAYKFVNNATATPFTEPNPGPTIPVIASVDLPSATTGDNVLITGTGFTGTTGVTMGGVAMTHVAVHNSGTQITATVPAGSAGSAPVIVTNALGASVAKSYTRT